jgi:ornithine cyclodeaminase/alanine dehydrogenase-like protein (mu-crystallin family)
VDAVWTFLSTKLNYLSGKRVAILGCGNIGSKLALKLVESGVNVVIMRRDVLKGESIASAINLIKPSASRGVATYNPSAVHASKLCDIVISAANANTPILTLDIIQNISKGGFIIDIGKGNVPPNIIKRSFEKNIDIIRADITASLYGFISHRQKIQDIIQCKMGRANIDSDISIVSGGIIGRCGEIVVDNFASPSLIYGVSDGIGNMKIYPNSTDKKNIETVKKIINMEHHVAQKE